MKIGYTFKRFVGNWFETAIEDSGIHKQNSTNVDSSEERYNDINDLVTGIVERYYQAGHVCDIKLDIGGLLKYVPILSYVGGTNPGGTVRGRRCPLRVGDNVVVGCLYGFSRSPIVIGCKYDFTKDGQDNLLIKESTTEINEDKEIFLNGVKIRSYKDVASGKNIYEIKSSDNSVILKIKDGVIELGNTTSILFEQIVDARITAKLNTHTHTYIPGAGTPVPTSTPIVPFVTIDYSTNSVKQGV